MWMLEVLAILMRGGGDKKFPLFKRGGGREKFYTVLSVCVGGGGGACTVSNPRFSHFIDPLPVINDQSLKGQFHVVTK